MMTMSEADLTELVYHAAKEAFTELFKQHPDEHFYYCSLKVDSEACGPAFTAWSLEALQKAAEADPEPDKLKARHMLKWSYGESPYFCFMDELFEPVRQVFNAQTAHKSPHFEEEWEMRMNAVVEAMHRLDSEGVFGTGDTREDMVLAVEVMPPDAGNTERVRRLNTNRRCLKVWMAEYDNS